MKNPADWLAGYRNPGQNNDQEEDQEEEEEQEGAEQNIVLNGEDNGDRQEDLRDAEDHGFIPMPPRSPRNSIESSKSVRIRGRSYQTQKQRINKLLSELEADPDKNHSEHLEKQATLLSTMLKDLDLTGIVSLADTEPDFIEVFGETEDQVSDWGHEAKFRIQDLMIRASKEVSDRKAVTQTGFKKLSHPQFNGDVLNYQEFKRRWRIEVVPERRPPALELAALRESIPAPAKAKIITVTTMAEAWKLLDLDYGDIEEVRAKLKREISSLKIKATSGPANDHRAIPPNSTGSCKIKATGSSSLLEDQEYVALVGNHLPEEIMCEWLKSEKSG